MNVSVFARARLTVAAQAIELLPPNCNDHAWARVDRDNKDHVWATHVHKARACLLLLLLLLALLQFICISLDLVLLADLLVQ